MDPGKIEALLREVREGRTEVAEALERLRGMPFEDLGFAKLDHHRGLRTGMPEVIFASGKTPAQVGQRFNGIWKRRIIGTQKPIRMTYHPIRVDSHMVRYHIACRPNYNDRAVSED